MVAISLLFIYMSFLLCLEPLMNQKAKPKTTTTTTTASNATRPAKQYQRQVNEDVNVDNPTQECVFSEPVATGLQSNRHRSSAVLNLVTHEQSKWRKQVFKFLYYIFSFV
jgi:hypothetical protein